MEEMCQIATKFPMPSLANFHNITVGPFIHRFHFPSCDHVLPIVLSDGSITTLIIVTM